MFINKISYTSWKDFQKCKYYFKMKHIDKIRLPFVGTVHTAFGKSIHYCFEVGIPKKLERKEMDKIFDEYFEKELKAQNILLPNKEEWKTKGRKVLDDFWNKSFNKLKNNVYSVEKRFNISFLNGSFSIVGFVDHITNTKSGGLGIIDYKTGKLKKLTDESEMQLSIYSLAIEKLLNIVPEWMCLYYVEHDKILYSFSNKKRNQETEEKLIGFYNNIKSMKEEDFTVTKESKNCFMCDFKNICKHIIGEGEQGTII